MADDAPPTRFGWLKTIIGTCTGLLSGAVVMYISPLVDRVVKPAKPVANFSAQANGLTATFHNRSTGPKSMQGWWDYGDGSPLEPVAPEQEFVTHAYQRPGEYTAKLSLRNSLGEENERTFTLKLDAGSGGTEPPKILELKAETINGEDAYAPATFKIHSKVANAQVCVWDTDEDRPLEINTDPAGEQDRLLTFQKPGGYVIKLAAVNGTQHDEKTEIVNVLEPPTGCITALLDVTDRAVQVDTVTRSASFSAYFPTDLKEPLYHFESTLTAHHGADIVDVRIPYGSNQGMSLRGRNEMALDPSQMKLSAVQNLRIQVQPDHKSVKLSGVLVKDNKTDPAPHVVVPVTVVEEHRKPVNRPGVPVTATLTCPGSVQLMLPPTPRNWQGLDRQVRVQLMECQKVVWQESKIPSTATVTLHGQRWQVTATRGIDQVKIELREWRSPTASVSK
jgi:PKD repeat protein